MTKRFLSFVSWISLFSVFFIYGCFLTSAYHYDDIKREYKETSYHSPKEKSATGPIDSGSSNLEISLKEAINIAVAQNPDILMAVARIEKTKAMLNHSKAPFYPSIGFYTDYIQGDAPSVFLFKTIDQRKLEPGTDFNDPGWFENYETGLKISMNLYSGGRDSLQLKMNEAELKISQLDRQQIVNQITATVISVYYDVLAAAEFIKTAEKSVLTVQSEHRIMDVRFKSGGVLKSDVLSLEVRLAQANERLVRYKNRYKIALAALANILGIEPNVKLLVKKADIPTLQIPQVYSEGIAYALDHRSELQKVREKLRQSSMFVDMSRANYFPRADFQSSYYFDDPQLDYSSDRKNYFAGIYLTWEIFNGFSTKYDHRKSLARLKEMLSADRKAVLSVKFDVKKAYINLNDAKQRLQVAKSSVKTAIKTLKLVEQQYEGGSATVTRYLEAEYASNQAQNSTTASFYDVKRAEAEIARAIGYWENTRPDGN